MAEKPKPNIEFLPSGDIVEGDFEEVVDDRVENLTELLSMEAKVIFDNLDMYPDIYTIEDLFDALKVPHKNQEDFTLAEIMREILTYDEEEEDDKIVAEEVNKGKYKDMFVEIPTKGLYAKIDLDSEDYQLVYQIAFLRADHYIPGKSDGMKVIPCLGKKVKRNDFEGNGLGAPYLVTCNAIKSHEDIEELRKFLLLGGKTTEPFVCGDYIYSLKSGILAHHGYLNSRNVESLIKEK